MHAYRRHELTDDQWERLAPLLPPEKSRTGRPNKDPRTVINGILWVLRTGAPWRDLPERYGPWKTMYSRFWRWQEAGAGDRILAQLQAEAAHDDALDASLSLIDRSNVRAHQHAAGAQKRGPTEQALGRSRGGFGSKLHLVTERGGKPIRWQFTGGQRHESPVAISLLETVLDRMWPEAVAGDKAYSTTEIRNWLRAREITTVIPPCTDEIGGTAYDRDTYRERSMVKRTINRLKRYRRIATRFEKLACRYSAMIALACILEWL